MRRWWWLLVLVVVASACGAGTTDSENASDGPGVVVESADGMATLLLPEGSLPPDVSIGDVTLEVIVDDDAVQGAPIVAVRLLPDGLELSQAAELTILLPEALDGGFMAIHQSGDTFEFLEGTIELPDDVPLFVASITHFSWAWFVEHRFATASIILLPTEVSKGQTQQADVTLTRNPDPSDLYVGFSSDPEGSYRKFVFSAPMPPISFGSSRVTWDRSPLGEPLVWDPFSVPVDLSRSDTGWTAQGFSMCLIENRKRVSMDIAPVTFNVEILAAGLPADQSFINFTRFATRDTSSVAQVRGGSIALLESSPGDVIEAVAYWYISAPTVCSAEPSTSSTTSTLPPIEEPPGEDPPDDQVDGSTSQPVTDSQRVDGAEIISTSYVPGDTVPHCFEIVVLGDGEQATDDALNYLVDIEVTGQDGLDWRVFVEFFKGEVRASRVLIGPKAPGRDKLEDAMITAEWVSPDTMRVCVDDGEAPLSVDTYEAKIDAFIDGGHVYDAADGEGPP